MYKEKCSVNAERLACKLQQGPLPQCISWMKLEGVN